MGRGRGGACGDRRERRVGGRHGGRQCGGLAGDAWRKQRAGYEGVAGQVVHRAGREGLAAGRLEGAGEEGIAGRVESRRGKERLAAGRLENKGRAWRRGRSKREESYLNCVFRQKASCALDLPRPSTMKVG